MIYSFLVKLQTTIAQKPHVYAVYMYLVLFGHYLKLLTFLTLFSFCQNPKMTFLTVEMCTPMFNFSWRVGTEVHPISPNSNHLKKIGLTTGS